MKIKNWTLLEEAANSPSNLLETTKPTERNMMEKEHSTSKNCAQQADMETTIHTIDDNDAVMESMCATDDASFWAMQSSPAAGAEQRYDFYGDHRLDFLKGEVGERNGMCAVNSPHSVFSARYIVQLAAERHFKMMAYARKSMREKFTKTDIVILLNSAMSSVSELRICLNMATSVADDLGIENLDELPEDSPTRILMDKLLSLTFFQDIALLELTENFWRCRGSRSISDFGLVLSEDVGND